LRAPLAQTPAHTPRKRFGQHFLHDPAVVSRMVAAVAPSAHDRVVEIGPGTGVLTAALLDALPRLHAVEIDRDLAAQLTRKFAGRGLELRVDDALQFDFTVLAAGPRSLRLIGNLPYNISTPLLFHLLEAREVIRDMHFMLQREVVTRLAAGPGGKTYGRLSVMVQTYCRVESLFRVGPGAFTPPPKVESAVVRLTPRDTLALAVEHLPALRRVVSAAFAQRRKTLRNALRGILPEADIVAAGIDPRVRPEGVTVKEFATLAAAAAAHPRATPGC
jgi:16S rRNA (adenine1518-N6/adenine1519-N6)-dimethyltransferase